MFTSKAAQLGYADVVGFLITELKKHNLGLDSVSENGKTPLFLGKIIKHIIACMEGYKEEEVISLRQEIIKKLIDSGANPNAMNTKTKMTCLHWACWHPEDSESVKRLIKAGADPLVKDHQNLTPIDIAGIKSKGRKNAVLDYLLEYFENYVDKSNKNPLIEESLENKITVKTSMSQYSVDDKLYLDLLYWSAYRNKIILVRKLIGKGISPFLNYVMNENALIAAIKGGAKEVIKFILKNLYEDYYDKSLNVRDNGNINK